MFVSGILTGCKSQKDSVHYSKYFTKTQINHKPIKNHVRNHIKKTIKTKTKPNKPKSKVFYPI